MRVGKVLGVHEYRIQTPQNGCVLGNNITLTEMNKLEIFNIQELNCMQIFKRISANMKRLQLCRFDNVV